MTTKKHDAKPGEMLRVWIEWEFPSLRHYTEKERIDRANEIANRINKMLARLFDGPPPSIWWHHSKQLFCVTEYPGGGFYECRDNGHWFNLEYVGRD